MNVVCTSKHWPPINPWPEADVSLHLFSGPVPKSKEFLSDR